MRYELMNRLYGHRIICDSEKSKNHFLANCKKNKQGKVDWEVNRELDDVVDKPAFTVEQLRKMLADAEASQNVDADSQNVDAAPVKRMGRPPKAIQETAQ
jgi:hypothetical protein